MLHFLASRDESGVEDHGILGVLDAVLRLGDESGFDVAKRLSELSPGLGVILISTHAEGDFVELITESPARGFLPKSKLSAEAIRQLIGSDS